MGRHMQFDNNVSRLANEQLDNSKEIIGEVQRLLEPGKTNLVGRLAEMSDVKEVVHSAVWTVLVIALNPAQNVLGDSITALGFSICFYYGLTGIACAIYYRRELRHSARNLVYAGSLMDYAEYLVRWREAADFRGTKVVR